MNKLMEELSTGAITRYDEETRVRGLAARWSAGEGLRVLDKFDAEFGRARRAGGDDPDDRHRATAENRGD